MPKYFTAEGLEFLKQRVGEKESKKRAIGNEVGEAAGDNCDWHDNAPFEDARARLELASADIGRLRADVNDAVVVAINEQADKVAIGTAVTVDVDGKAEKTYIIGAAYESVPKEGLVAYDTPIASALLGMSVGDTVEVPLRGRTMELTIKSILPPSAKYQQLAQKIYSPSLAGNQE